MRSGDASFVKHLQRTVEAVGNSHILGVQQVHIIR